MKLQTHPLNNTRTVQAESSNFASLSFDQGFKSAPIAIHEKNLKTAEVRTRSTFRTAVVDSQLQC